jgi:hypothetical protein
MDHHQTCHVSRGRDLYQTPQVTLPTFSGVRDEIGMLHVQMLDEFMVVKGVPPPLQLSVVMRSLKGQSIRVWASAPSDVIHSYDYFK